MNWRYLYQVQIGLDYKITVIVYLKGFEDVYVITEKGNLYVTRDTDIGSFCWPITHYQTIETEKVLH